MLALLLSVTVAPMAACLAEQTRGSVVYRTLIGRNETIRFRAIQQLQFNPVARHEALQDLIAALKHHVAEIERDDLVRPSTVALINLIAEVDDADSEAVLVELLDASHVGIAMLSADALGRKKFYGAIDALKRQVDRPEYQAKYAFRFNLVRSMAQMEHPDAIEFLGSLRYSLDGQLRYHLDTLLENVTIEQFRGDEKRYEQFRNPDSKAGDSKAGDSQGESFFKTANYEPESLQRMRLKPQQYYGIDIQARRLMFVIDNSGSMKDYWGGMTRLERAKFELTRAIEELPGEAEFAIVFYNTTIRHWRNELLPATEENKRAAIDFIRRLGYGDKTNTYGALRYSLEFDDQLEAVFLLTDGKPTVGEITVKSAIVNDILHRNRFRHLNFNTIGIALDAGTKSFLQTLATESNGEFREAL